MLAQFKRYYVDFIVQTEILEQAFRTQGSAALAQGGEFGS
jgi:hypothetical protein